MPLLTKGLADLAWKDASPGALTATFSTFGVVDRDGDITLPSAFTDGQAVPMVWSHDWHRPVGRGTIRVLPDRAVFDGQFFLQTAWGQDAYETVKAMGDLQEYSYGFQIKEAAPGTHDSQPVRVLKSLEVFEVSPVLVGAGVGTGTERLKVGRRFSSASRREIQSAIDALARLIADIAEESDLEESALEQEPPAAPPAPKAAPAGPTLAWLARYRTRYRLGGV